MKINIKAKVLFDDRLGRLVKDQIIDVPEHKALFYVARKEAELYETKVTREKPLDAAGKPASALPVGQVLTKQMLKQSDSGEKKAKQTKKV